VVANKGNFMDEYEVIVPPKTLTTQEFLNELTDQVHSANEKWWRDINTGEPVDKSNFELKGTKLMLMVSEIAEAMEGERKELMDDKLPHRKMAEVELADAVIRIFDYSAAMGYDLGGAFVEKMAYNTQRADHKVENRLKPGGKKF
jgi:NTP pyrophosphatase (non-canonical NTP hydrolase)